MKKFFKFFVVFGCIGWCLEVLFTALGSLRNRDYKCTGNSSLWMFPIYGMASCLIPLFHLLKKTSIWIRGLLYALLIFIGEYLSGKFLTKKGVCPWDYTSHRWNINGLICLTYLPCWFISGLLFESIYKINVKKSKK